MPTGDAHRSAPSVGIGTSAPGHLKFVALGSEGRETSGLPDALGRLRRNVHHEFLADPHLDDDRPGRSARGRANRLINRLRALGKGRNRQDRRYSASWNNLMGIAASITIGSTTAPSHGFAATFIVAGTVELTGISSCAITLGLVEPIPDRLTLPPTTRLA